MISNKRKLPFAGLGRRVRPRKEEEDEDVIEDSGFAKVSEDESGSESGAASEEETSGSDQEDEEDSGGDEASEGLSAKPTKTSLDISAISFGALAKAQTSMPGAGRRRRKGAKEPEEATDDEESDDPKRKRKSDSKGRPVIETRTSKHAPTEMSSKRQVSRKREVIAVPKLEVRDPRFDPLSGGGARFDEAKAQKAYAFLDEYREDEMRQLREQIRQTKNPATKEQLQRTLMSMESRKKARERKMHEQKIIEEHKVKEKELVKQGKQPFYLKKSEQKKRLLLDQFAGMKKKQVDRAIERRRKKIAGREKKELGQLERVRKRD